MSSAVRRILGLTATVILAAACTSGSTADDESSDPRTPAAHPVGWLAAAHRWVGPPGSLDDAATSGDTVLGLASSARPGAADTLVRSGDGGRSWRAVNPDFGEAPLGTDQTRAGSPAAVARPRVWMAGDVAIASRWWNPHPLGSTDGAHLTQALTISTDHGSTWSGLELEGRSGRRPLVNDVAGHGNRIVLVGTLQDDRSTAPTGGLDHFLDSFDAAAWVSDDGGRSFDLIDAPFDPATGLQTLSRVLVAGDRFVAIGQNSSQPEDPARDDGMQGGPLQSNVGSAGYPATSFASTDGRTWTHLESLPRTDRDPVYLGLRVQDGEVSFGLPWSATVLPADADRWEARSEREPKRRPNAKIDLIADEALLADRSTETTGLATWMTNSACDCSWAFGGRYGDGSLIGQRIAFDCTDTSVRGDEWIGQPHRDGHRAVALAACDDHGLKTLAVATSTDDGATWRTQRLTWAAARRGDDLHQTDSYPPLDLLAVGGGYVVMGNSSPQVEVEQGDEPPANKRARRIVAIRLDP